MSKTDDPTPRKSGKLVKIGGIALLLAAGVGGGAYAASSGLVGDAHADDNRPKLVRKGETDPYAPAAKESESESVGEEEATGGDPYRLSYFAFDDDFTSNLRESNHFVQLGLAAATPYDGRVVAAMKRHELALRSEILLTLADTAEDEVFSADGKRRLTERLVKAINRVLIAQDGFGGVKSVHFKTFIVQ